MTKLLPQQLNDLTAALQEIKALNINTINVSKLTSIADWMIIVTGTSSRHVKAICQAINLWRHKVQMPCFKIEGEHTGEWVLVDLGDAILHIMLETSREFYQLDKLWGTC